MYDWEGDPTAFPPNPRPDDFVDVQVLAVCGRDSQNHPLFIVDLGGQRRAIEGVNKV